LTGTTDWPEALGGTNRGFRQSEEVKGVCYIKFPSQTNDFDLMRCSADINGANDGSEPTCPWEKIVMADATPRAAGSAVLPGNRAGLKDLLGLTEWWKTGMINVGPLGLCRAQVRSLARMCCGNNAAAVAKLEARLEFRVVPLQTVMALDGQVPGPSECCDVGFQLPARCRGDAPARQTAAELNACPKLDGSECYNNPTCVVACALQRATCACSLGMQDSAFGSVDAALTAARATLTNPGGTIAFVTADEHEVWAATPNGLILRRRSDPDATSDIADPLDLEVGQLGWVRVPGSLCCASAYFDFASTKVPGTVERGE
jgi:hypothetical protein